MKMGWDAVHSWPADLDMDFTKQKVDGVRQLAAIGSEVCIEHEMCVNGALASCDWWDENALLRAKADALILTPEPYPILITDIKTGKKWDEESFQLRVECLLAHLIYKRPVIKYAYWYVDYGDTVSGTIDFSTNGLAEVRDIIDLIKEMRQAITSNIYEPRKNRFCKWCGLYKTPECGLC